jgi:hypothetical protein
MVVFVEQSVMPDAAHEGELATTEDGHVMSLLLGSSEV